MTMITGAGNIEFAALLMLRKRLELEIKFPHFAKGRTGDATMRGVKHRFPAIKTRKAALSHLNTILKGFDEAKAKS